MTTYTPMQKLQLEKIDKVIEQVRTLQENGQWETLQRAKTELYLAREKMVRGYDQANQRNNND